jgi:hypothetical protein
MYMSIGIEFTDLQEERYDVAGEYGNPGQTRGQVPHLLYPDCMSRRYKYNSVS